MERRGYEALLIYGDNKLVGNLRYLTDYFPDRAGWISLGPTQTYMFEGALLVLTLCDEPSLLLDPGLMAGKEICTKRILRGEGLSTQGGQGLSARNIADILTKAQVHGRVGVEGWDRFPIPLYLGLRELVPEIQLERSTVVEELRMIKSPMEIEIFRRAGKVGDLAHSAFVENLKRGVGRSELEIVRAAEQVMRSADPIYEDSCMHSPALIYSGQPVGDSLLNLPSHVKKIRNGDVVHWDIGMRHEGYTIDTSRTKVVGTPTEMQSSVYDTTLEMMRKVVSAAKPGIAACELVEIADKVAKESGHELWLRFLGHGTGLDAHERPDMGVENTRLASNMVLAIEPRIALGVSSLIGVEDMVLITENGGEPLISFEKSLEL